MWLPRNASQQSVCNKSVSDMSVFLFFFFFYFLIFVLVRATKAVHTTIQVISPVQGFVDPTC